MEEYRLECLPFIDTLSQALGDSTYLKGDCLSVTDIVILPFVRQFAHVDLTWFEHSTAQNIQQWLRSFLNDPLFLSVMKKYPQWSSESEPVYFP
jgi:glutathione S-transferase